MIVLKTSDTGPLAQAVWFLDASGKRMVSAAEFNASQQVGMKIATLALGDIEAIPDSPKQAPAPAPTTLPVTGGTITLGG